MQFYLFNNIFCQSFSQIVSNEKKNSLNFQNFDPFSYVPYLYHIRINLSYFVFKRVDEKESGMS